MSLNRTENVMRVRESDRNGLRVTGGCCEMCSGARDFMARAEDINIL